MDPKREGSSRLLTSLFTENFEGKFYENLLLHIMKKSEEPYILTVPLTFKNFASMFLRQLCSILERWSKPVLTSRPAPLAVFRSRHQDSWGPHAHRWSSGPGAVAPNGPKSPIQIFVQQFLLSFPESKPTGPGPARKRSPGPEGREARGDAPNPLFGTNTARTLSG